jgi:predicted CXXCH cytochrome family protein
MKTWQSKLKSIGAAALVLCAFAWTGASAQITGTKHDLSAGSGNAEFSGTGEICVFCHTPHGSNQNETADAVLPIWNRNLSTETYQTYRTVQSSPALTRTSLDGASLPVGSVSIACLSCHDGTQAMDTLLNDPGSGAEVTTFTNGTWTGSTGTIAGIADLTEAGGASLQNDHPIGIQYAGGGYAVGVNLPKDLDFKPALNAPINGTTVWWVDSGTAAGTRDKADMQLYTRQLASVDQPFVECASCHDPHTANDTFLRIQNTGSAVCLACHTK